ncbi:MAG: phage portal protein [Gemmatimonadetes bacterium]|nr:phage portal protein [Gemmatimonadota bacterium]
MFERLKQGISGFFDTPNASPEKKGGVRHQPRPHFIQRSIDGNSLTDRTQNLGRFLEINSEIITALERVRSRARFLYVNDPLVSNAVDTWVSEAIGTGLRPSPVIDQPRQILDAWEMWSDACDFDRITNFEGLQSDIALALKRDGEALILLHETEEGLKLQHLDAARLDSQKTSSQYYSQNQNIVISGIEFNPEGQRVGYWLRTHLDNDVYNYTNLGSPDSVRIPARRIIHIIDRRFPGQIRGLSPLASVILSANDLQMLMDASRQAAIMSSFIAGFISDPNGTAESFDLAGQDRAEWTPGSLLDLGSSQIQFANPQQNASIHRFTNIHLRQLASGLQMPAWLVDGDLSEINYSSARAGLIPFRRKLEAWRETKLKPQFLNPVWSRWSAMEFVQGNYAGMLPKAGWIAPAWEQVDPLKATASIIAQLEAGLIDQETAVRQIHGHRASHILQNLDSGMESGSRSTLQHLTLIHGDNQ